MAKKIPSTYKSIRPGNYITVIDSATGKLVDVDKLTAIDAVTRHIPVPAHVAVVADPLNPEVIVVLDSDAEPAEVYALLKVVRGRLILPAHVGKRTRQGLAAALGESRKRKSLWAYLADWERKQRLLKEATRRELPPPWKPAIPTMPPETPLEVRQKIQEARKREEEEWKRYLEHVKRLETEEDRSIARREIERAEREAWRIRERTRERTYEPREAEVPSYEPREYVTEPAVRPERPIPPERPVREDRPTRYPPGSKVVFRDAVTGKEYDVTAESIYNYARGAFRQKDMEIPPRAEPLDIELFAYGRGLTIVDAEGDALMEIRVENEETKFEILVDKEDLIERYKLRAIPMPPAPPYEPPPSSLPREEEGRRIPERPGDPQWELYDEVRAVQDSYYLSEIEALAEAEVRDWLPANRYPLSFDGSADGQSVQVSDNGGIPVGFILSRDGALYADIDEEYWKESQ